VRADDAIKCFLEHLKAFDRSPKTIIGYASDIRRFQRYFEAKYNFPWSVEDTQTSDIYDFLVYLRDVERLQPASRNRIQYALSSFFRYCHGLGICSTNYAAAMQPIRYDRTERMFLLPEEIETLISAIPYSWHRTVAWTLALTGMRISECLSLRFHNVDLVKREIRVGAETTKSHRHRVIPICRKLHAILLDYLQFRNELPYGYGKFFASPQTGRLSPTQFNRVLHQTTERLGWNCKVTAHVFRHSFATELLRKGVSIKHVQDLLGHSNLWVTSAYLHLTENDLRDAVSVLDDGRF
jgi:integrase/recombinase XerD